MPITNDLFHFLGSQIKSNIETIFVAGGKMRSILTNEDTGSGLGIDDITNSLQMIDVVHHEIHEGETYQASYKSPDASNIADNGTIDILVKTGAKYCHLAFEIAAGGDAEILLYEDTTTSNDGTPLVEHNMNRGIADSATAAAFHTPTVTDVGTLLENRFVPGGAGGNSQGGSGTIRPGTEWILNINKNYLVRGINRAGTAQPMSNIVQWYEESANG